MDLQLFFDSLQEIGNTLFPVDEESFVKVVALVLANIDALRPKVKTEVKGFSLSVSNKGSDVITKVKSD